MRKIVWLILLTCGAIWWGGHSLWIAMRNRDAVEVTCADYLRARPDAEWLRLTQCEPDLDNVATLSTKAGSITDVYIPLRPAGEAAKARPARIIVQRRDDEILELAGRLRHGVVTDATAARLDAAFAGPTEGLIQRGLDLSEPRQAELASLDLGLDPDFVILEQGAAPRPIGYAIGSLALGALGVGSIGLLLRRRGRR